MREFLIILAFLIGAPSAQAAGNGVHLDRVYINLNDRAALQNGVRLFANYCLSCHNASFMRYSRMAEDLDLSEDLVRENLMFAGDKIGGLMQTTMPADDAKKWFGVTPPDLSLVARSRGADWLYTYLRSFYLDPESPSGWNNTVFDHVAMPHALYELQGSQKLVAMHGEDEHSGPKFELELPGKLTPVEYDKSMRDLTNFLVYLAEPAKLKRYGIGIWVLIFLGVLGTLAFFLKKEYWRDIH
ncbi:MAG: cytochrome c1 [Arenicellales bacterium WSBS_2016_MAG_OTU3]